MRISKATGWSREKPMSLCIGFLKNHECILGLSTGSLAIVRGGSIGKLVLAHKKMIFAMCSNNDFSRLFTGGADGKVILWDENLKPLQEIIVNGNNFISINPKVRALDYDNDTKKLLIGTRGSEIIEYNTNTKERKIILNGHFNLELWGLAQNPSKDEFVTVGEDF